MVRSGWPPDVRLVWVSAMQTEPNEENSIDRFVSESSAIVDPRQNGQQSRPLTAKTRQCISSRFIGKCLCAGKGDSRFHFDTTLPACTRSYV
jgi:hypothetical protein